MAVRSNLNKNHKTEIERVRVEYRNPAFDHPGGIERLYPSPRRVSTEADTVTQSLDGHVEMGITEELEEAAERADENLPPALKIPTQIKNEITTKVTKLTD